jgi:hypothetical protein
MLLIAVLKPIQNSSGLKYLPLGQSWGGFAALFLFLNLRTLTDPKTDKEMKFCALYFLTINP